MEMTSPVINTINTDGSQQPQMQFPMEAKYGQSLEALPNPSDGRCGVLAPFSSLDSHVLKA